MTVRAAHAGTGAGSIQPLPTGVGRAGGFLDAGNGGIDAAVHHLRMADDEVDLLRAETHCRRPVARAVDQHQLSLTGDGVGGAKVHVRADGLAADGVDFFLWHAPMRIDGAALLLQFFQNAGGAHADRAAYAHRLPGGDVFIQIIAGFLRRMQLHHFKLIFAHVVDNLLQKFIHGPYLPNGWDDGSSASRSFPEGISFSITQIM